ncbi:hypothetical protein [Streptomyces sp. fd1-xmd]|uniref:hypothetical protein n=1 Tax=Streptomyces sp. fd1-xmd TaxID=1812480 RepID=UPI0009908D0E|nr:hypothetical protein [Streptomyces sp. fd1-xmd]AQT70586.1 hypothetical protein B1K54_01565 [Streptomyces sp. fd1-xmd]
MGLDLTLCMADWKHLGGVPVVQRIQALGDATLWAADDEGYQSGRTAGSWLWPPDREAAWCAEYDFRSTSGSFAPHARAGDAWDDMRPLADASLRAAVDAFLTGLIWDEDPADDPAPSGGGGFFPPAADRWRSSVLLVCPPEALPGKVRAWARAECRLEELREAFAAECEGWAGRPASFEHFIALLREWGDITTEAARRGWGLVGLP